jgi:serine protease
VPGTQVMALLVPDPGHPEFKLLVEYASEPINQSTLYCQETIAVNEPTILEDGSGDQSYSPQTDCKWLITAPAGKVIHIEFLEFDTEANVDWLYFFNGTGTHEKIMAVSSGSKLPPELTTWSNQVLLWFVTDSQN